MIKQQRRGCRKEASDNPSKTKQRCPNVHVRVCVRARVCCEFCECCVCVFMCVCIVYVCLYICILSEIVPDWQIN